MSDDPIVAEVRKIREEMLASYGGDYKRMFRDMMKRQWESGHPVVSVPPGELADQSNASVAESGAGYVAAPDAEKGKSI